MSRMSEHLDSVWPQMAGRYAAYKNVMAVNLGKERKRMFLVMLVTVAAFISVFTTTFARATEPMPGDRSAMKVTTSSTSSQWQVLKLGQNGNGNGITFKRVGNDAIAFLDKTPIEKCVSGSDYQGLRENLEYKLEWSRVISAASHTGQYVAVFCTSGSSEYRYLDDAYGVHLINLKTKTFFSPGPSKLFQLLQPWISFSPDDRYAVLNQAGDEGDYAPLVLDLNTRRAKILAAPLFPHEEGAQTIWLNDKTVKYRQNNACDDKSCKSVGTYEFEVNVSTMKVKRKRVGN